MRQLISVLSGVARAFGNSRPDAISDCLDLLDISADELSWTLSASENQNGTYRFRFDITFENTAGSKMVQAVALRSDSDLSVFHRCGIRGYQDSLYAHSNRQFYRDCKISGTVDFIFGDATAVFQNCQILARQASPKQINTITAHGRKYPDESTGFSIQFCNISADSDLLAAAAVNTYLDSYVPW